MASISKRVLEAVRKAFRLGPAVVSPYDTGMRTFIEGGFTPDYVPKERYQELSVAVYACTKLRSQTIGSVPLKVYQLDAQGNKQEVTSGPLVDLLRFVNPHWTPARLWQMTESAMCIWGQAFWVLEGMGPQLRQRPTEIWWARSDKMRVIPDRDGYVKGYEYHDANTKLYFQPQEVIWFRYPNPANEFAGLSPLDAARVSVETSVDAMRANASIFANGMQPGAIISPSDSSITLTREERELIEAQLARRLTGADRRHRVMVFSHQMNMATPSMSPKDAEFMALMGWTLNDVCRVYQVPPMKVQDFSRATYSNAEQADKAFWTDCITPELALFASELTEQLAPLFGEGLIVEFDLSQVRSLQEDQIEITDQMAKLAAMGVPLNRLLQVYRPDLLPEGGTGYPWGDLPLQQQMLGGGILMPAPVPEELPPAQQQASAPVEVAKSGGYPFLDTAAPGTRPS